VAASVRFLGSVDESTKQALLALCDVFVMPSRLVSGRPWEGFGISYLEAAAAGRPAVGGRVGGTGDAIVDGVTGLLVDSTGPRPTFNALSRLLTDAELRTRLGQAGRERVQRQFLWPSVAAGFLREAGLSL
jgi:phosphatidylinositol alpha-1,6-mannosyltransferase